MSEITINGLLQEAGPIKDATNDNENTALKVGNMFIHIIQYLLKYQNHIESGGGNNSELGQLTPINLGLILADLNDLNSYPENNDLVLVWNHTSNSGWDFLPYGGGSQVPGLLGTGDVTWLQLGRAPEPNTQQINLGHLDLSAYTKNTDSWWGNTPSTLLNGTHTVTGSLRGGIQYIRFDRSVTNNGTTTDYLVYLGLDENGNLRLSHNENGTGTADFYAIGGVSALGNSSGGSGGGSDSEGLSTPLNNLLTDLNRIADGFGSNNTYYTIKKDNSGWTLGTNNLGNLNDVVYNGTPSPGQYLAFDGNNWRNVDASPNQSSGVNIISGNSALAWDTEQTLATINGTKIKAKLPLLPTDEKVKLSYVSNTNSNYPILFSNTPNLNSPAPVTESVNRSDNNLYYNPSTKTLTVLNISGKATSATSATNDSANHKITDHYVHSITTSNNTLTYKDGDGDSLGTASLVNSISNTWTAGTTAGPTIQTTVNGVAGTAVAIPSAGASASGIVTTGALTFAGSKTFNSKIIGNLQGNADTATKFKNSRILWGNLDNGDNSIGTNDHLDSLLYVKLIVFGNGNFNTNGEGQIRYYVKKRDVNDHSNTDYYAPNDNLTSVEALNFDRSSTKNQFDIGWGLGTILNAKTVLYGREIEFVTKLITNSASGSGSNSVNMILNGLGQLYILNSTNEYTSGLRIGNAVLYCDASGNLALKSATGGTCNFYATGGVSALGLSPGSGSGSVPAMTFGNLTVNNKLSFNSSGANIIANQATILGRSSQDINNAKCINLFYDYDNSKIRNNSYYYNLYTDVGLKGETYVDNAYTNTWSIDPDGCAKFSRVYLSDNAYIYFDSNNVKLKIGTNTYTLTKQ